MCSPSPLLLRVLLPLRRSQAQLWRVGVLNGRSSTAKSCGWWLSSAETQLKGRRLNAEPRAAGGLHKSGCKADEDDYLSGIANSSGSCSERILLKGLGLRKTDNVQSTPGEHNQAHSQLHQSGRRRKFIARGGGGGLGRGHVGDRGFECGGLIINDTLRFGTPARGATQRT